ncbi:A32.5L, partial [Monkeypox virus]
PIKDE